MNKHFILLLTISAFVCAGPEDQAIQVVHTDKVYCNGIPVYVQWPKIQKSSSSDALGLLGRSSDEHGNIWQDFDDAEHGCLYYFAAFMVEFMRIKFAMD